MLNLNEKRNIEVIWFTSKFNFDIILNRYKYLNYLFHRGGKMNDAEKSVRAALEAELQELQVEREDIFDKLKRIESRIQTLRKILLENATEEDDSVVEKVSIAPKEISSEDTQSKSEPIEKADSAKSACEGEREEVLYSQQERFDLDMGVRVNRDGKPDREGKYILFGEYPQTLKADDVTASEKIDESGYYVGSDGAKYAKVVANTCWYDSDREKYRFGNGSNIRNDVAYYFKVEPIRWRILEENNDIATIICDGIIANRPYDHEVNNYESSEIRAWLNSEFYKKAFNSFQQKSIMETVVDNSATSTGDSGSRFACNDTHDKIFLLSYKEATEREYGFTNGNDEYCYERRMSTSDYARANGAWTSVNSNYSGLGFWWLRSPVAATKLWDGAHKQCVYTVNDTGSIQNGGGPVDGHCGGVVPALNVKLFSDDCCDK